MAIIDDRSSLYVLGITGKIGIPNGLGLIKCGWTRLGYENRINAIYQRKVTLKGKKISKMRHYKPTNSRMPYQQFWRDYFRTAVKIYHGLASETFDLYSKRSKKFRMTVFNYFISQYTYEKPAHLGNYRAGWSKLGVLTFIQ